MTTLVEEASCDMEDELLSRQLVLRQCLRLDQHIEVGRGDVTLKPGGIPRVARIVFWADPELL
jgi:hypothetical protein